MSSAAVRPSMLCAVLDIARRRLIAVMRVACAGDDERAVTLRLACRGRSPLLESQRGRRVRSGCDGLKGRTWPVANMAALLAATAYPLVLLLLGCRILHSLQPGVRMRGPKWFGRMRMAADGSRDQGGGRSQSRR